MDKLRELLISIFGEDVVNGLTDEQVAQLTQFIDSYILKEDVEDALEEGWKQEDGTIDLEKIKNGDLKEVIQNLTNDVSTAKADAETAKTDADNAKAELGGVKKQTAVLKLIAKYPVADEDDILKFLDLESVTVKEDGSTEGLKEQLDALQKSKPYLFVEDTSSTGKDKTGGFNPKAGKQNTNPDPKTLSWADAYLVGKQQ